MAISKPSWLRVLLNKLNWDIFTWKVYIGDAIERGIDWALGWVNWGVDLAQAAYNKALEARDKALEVYRELLTIVNKSINEVFDKVSTWWSELGEWWSAKRQDIKDWIDDAKRITLSQIDAVRITLRQIDTAWDNFRTVTLPKLLDTGWITSFFGARVSSITDWWRPEKQKITDEIETEVQPVRDEVNKHTSWLDLIKELFTDPEKWLMNMIERMLARFW